MATTSRASSGSTTRVAKPPSPIDPDVRTILGIATSDSKAIGLDPAPGYDRAALRRIGRSRREVASHRSHGTWVAPDDRPDPLKVLEATNVGRLADLVPVRIGRMIASPFAHLRGSPAMMACDLAAQSATGIRVQACGDAHISNFGIYASPERRLIFDVNDFDETLPAPWEWDLKRVAVSAVVAGIENGLDASSARDLALVAGRAYREFAAQLAEMTLLEVWYASVEVDRISQLLDAPRRKKVAKIAGKARRHDSVQALRKLTEIVDGKPRIREEPPLIVHTPETSENREAEAVLAEYAASLRGVEGQLLSGFRVVDVARKVVGVGSVGTRCFVVLLAGKTDGSPLFLQVKEAVESVLEPFAGKSGHADHGLRVVEGQLLMQAASDPFLGYMTVRGRDYYVRQLRDMKGSIEISALKPEGLAIHTSLCAATLARAHARTCHPALIAGYLGSGESFDEAIADFAVAYAEQNEKDFEKLTDAVRQGKLKAEVGI